MQRIQLSHGSGGVMSQRLIDEVFKKYLGEFLIADREDGGVFVSQSRLASSTDSFVVSPVEFAGADIGKLSVCGSCNDVVMMGAKPRYLTLGFILEEGLEIALLERILSSMQKEMRALDLKILSADTKVVPQGSMDQIFINVTAIGEVIKPLSIHAIQEGDVLILSSNIGAHGSVIFCARHEINLQSPLKSDCRCLYPFLHKALHAPLELHALRDATRGGLAAVLNEWAEASGCDLILEEESIKILPEVRGVCEILGLEAYSLANEGAFVCAVKKEDAPALLALLHENGLDEACVIGEVRAKKSSLPRVVLKNAWGSARFLDSPVGEILPRIC